MSTEIKFVTCPATDKIREFAIATTPVTQAQYFAVLGENPSYFKGENRPVERVSWHDAMKFCEELTKQHRADGIIGEDEVYDLPTEDEWKHAATCGGTEPLAYGPLEDIGWFYENSGMETHPVGEKLPNKWGLYDMLGNVWEWTKSLYE